MNEEIYDFQAGDIFEYREYCYTGGYSLCERFYIDTIFSRDETSGTITYGVHHREKRTEYLAPTPVVTLGYSAFMSVVNKGYADLLDTAKMPEEKNCDKLYRYNAVDDQYCHTSDLYTVNWGALFNIFEVCGSGRYTKLGYGTIVEAHCYDPSLPYGGERFDLIYSVKNGVPCGKFVPVPVAVDDVAAATRSISVSPCPIVDNAKISLPTVGIYRLSVSDLLGRVVYTTQMNGNEYILSCQDMISGTYIVTVTDNEGTSYHQKIQVSH